MIHHLAKMVSTYLWLGDRNGLEMYVGLLRSIVTQQPKAMEVIPKTDRDRFLYVVDCFTNGIQPIPWKPGPRDPVKTLRLEKKPESEADLQKTIAFDQDKLVTICDHLEPRYVQLEATAGDGRVDISFLAGRTAHAVELKITRADHRVVGQIQKYMRALGSQIHYNIYDHVSGWVVAPDFEADAALELSDIGVGMIRLIHPH